MGKIPAALIITTNPTGYLGAAGAIYAASVMITNAYNHHGVISVPVILAAVTAVASLLTRQIVTPVAAPKDGAGRPLVPAPAVPVSQPQPDGGSVHLVPPPEVP